MSITITNLLIKINLLKFSGGEVHVQLENLPKKAPQEINMRANIRSSDDLMALLLVNNALQNQYGKGIKVNVEIPYFPYARQDRVCAVGQAFSLQVVANMINEMKLNSLTVWDAHSDVTQTLTGAINISQNKIIAADKSLVAELKKQNVVLVCPDKGAKNKCKNTKEKYSVKSIIYAEKVRDVSNGEIIDTQLSSNDLSNKTAIIVDDICDGGRTFIEIAKKLREKRVKRIILMVTHGIFSKGLEVFDGLIDEIYTTNSFPQMENERLIVIDLKIQNRTNDK